MNVPPDAKSGLMASARLFFLSIAGRVALVYWIGMIALFFALELSMDDMGGFGAAPLIPLTLPWSRLVMMFWPQGPAIGSLAERLSTSAVSALVVLPVLSAGANVLLLFVIWSLLQRRRTKGTRLPGAAGSRG